MSSSRRRSGFTLIELAIALVVVGVLTSLALPSYQGVIRKSRRTEAQAVLLELALRQERWRSDHPTYAQSPPEIGAANQATRLGRYYRFEVINATPISFTVQAIAISGAGQELDKRGGVTCTPLQVDQSGARLPTDCW